jgi:hypothetical protein
VSEDKMKWMISGDCTEACTSPPVCPYYWGSSTPTDLHDGLNQCEGVFTFHIQEGYFDDVKLDGLNAGFGFNSPVGGITAQKPWKSILYIDARADEKQAAALEEIFKTCWSRMGEVLKVKKAPITFFKEQVGGPTSPGYKHKVEFEGCYKMEADPLMTMNGLSRYISGMMGGKIYVGKSTVNRYKDDDLPRGDWDRPEMSNTYYMFMLNPDQLEWVP